MAKVIVPGFHEKWFVGQKAEVFTRIIEAWEPIDGDVIEVGSWEGRSAIMLANRIVPRVLHIVDHWQGGTAGGPLLHRRAAARPVKAQFLTNIAAYTQGNIMVHEGDWREFFDPYPNVDGVTGTIALAHIDADHTYDAVYDNIVRVLQFSQPGTLIIGDDFEQYPTQEQAVMDALPHAQHEGETWWYTVTAQDVERAQGTPP